MKLFVCLFLSLTIVVSATAVDTLPIVPLPTSIEIGEGQCKLPNKLTVAIPKDELWRKHLKVVAELLARQSHGEIRLVFADSDEGFLKINKIENDSAEAYLLNVTADQIQIDVSSIKGLCHATATLLQLIATSEKGSLQTAKISDTPQMTYRNFMIDMGRNPHSADLLKETIDLLWLYKVDSLQLHLTDDQRFAFPSTKYPKLWDGIITLDEFKAIEAYAVDRGVTIIPEFEVPGHSGILRGRYPDVFGKNPSDLAREDAAFEGIKTILDEMMEVFSSPYIHIGGDEAYGVPEELQRDLINKLHAYLKTKGRQTIVWEGPRPGKGENKVNTEVIHLNWRMINYSPKQMLADGYRVVNAAWDPLYIVDHYPRSNFTMTSPQYIYENLQPTRFKHVNPGIPTFGKPVEVEQTDRLIGFCMPWWEGREKNFFPQIAPRLIAFSEVAWNPEQERDFENFKKRAQKSESARRALLYPVSITPNSLAVESDGVFHDSVEIKLSSDHREETEIRYTLDGKQPTASSSKYTEPLKLDRTATVRAALFKDGNRIGHGSRRNLEAVKIDKKIASTNLAFGKPVTSSITSGSPFSIQRITDGGTGNLEFYLGYPTVPKPIEITVDLEEVKTISRVVVHAYKIYNSFEKYKVEISEDGKAFTEVASRLEKPEKVENRVEHPFDPQKVRYIRIVTHGNKGHVFDSFSKISEVEAFE